MTCFFDVLSPAACLTSNVRFSHLSSVTVFLLLCQCSQTKHFVNFMLTTSQYYVKLPCILWSVSSHCCLPLQTDCLSQIMYQHSQFVVKSLSWTSWNLHECKVKINKNHGQSENDCKTPSDSGPWPALSCIGKNLKFPHPLFSLAFPGFQISDHYNVTTWSSWQFS